jgi:hypothetical protein
MAELMEVLGTILRDVARSRVISDTFSRDISREYEQDPILVDFPVPRVEIKEASIQLQFAVNTVEHKEVDAEGIKRAGVARHAAEMGQALYERLIAEHPNRDEVQEILEGKGVDLPAQLPALIERAMLSNLAAVDAAVGGQPAALVKEIGSAVNRAFRADDQVWNALKKKLLVRELTERANQAIGAGVGGLAQEVDTALKDAKREALRVDIAVTRDELADLPEAVLSNVHLVTSIRNYEWTEVGEVDGKPVRRLRPE